MELIGEDVLTFDFTTIERLIAGSAVNYVTDQSPPTLLRYAGDDDMVPASQGLKRLHDALVAEGYDCDEVDNGDVEFQEFRYTKAGSPTHNLFYYPNEEHNLDYHEEYPRPNEPLYADYWAMYDWYFDEYFK